MLEGYAPVTEVCAVCGRSDIREPVFLPEEGLTVCRTCRKTGKTLLLTQASLAVLRYVMQAPAKRMLGFRLPEKDLDLLSKVSEAWLLQCVERSLPSLSYYYRVKLPPV